MTILRRISLFALAITLGLSALSSAHAQTPTTHQVQPISGRYAITLPEDWLASTEELRGLQGLFLQEIVVIGDSTEALASLGDVDPTKPKVGQTMIANIFPTALAWQGSPTYEADEVFANILGPSATSASFLSIDDKPAVQTRDYFGPPYNNASFAGQTMILDGNLVYYIIYSGQSEEDIEALEAIAATFTVTTSDDSPFDVDKLAQRPAFTTSDGRFQMPLGQNWMIAQSQTGLAEAFLIMPDPDAILPFVFGGQMSDALPSLYIQVVSQPYDGIFGTANFASSQEDRATVLDQTINSVAGIPDGDITEFFIDTAPAMRIDLNGSFDGDNRGVSVLVDPNQTMYSVTLAGPSEDWENEYLPLVNTLIDNLEVNVIEASDSAAGELPIGLQVGQLAPNFTVTLSDGSVVSLSDYRGKTILLNFWATWCAPCRVEMPELQQAYSDNASDVVVLGVNLMERLDQITAYGDELGLTFPLALDPNGSINSLYRVQGYPTTYVIDTEGIIREVNVGPIVSGQSAVLIERARQ